MISGKKHLAQFRRGLVFLHLALALGCGKSLPVASEREKADAREALVTALDAWKAGKVNGLKSRTPPVKFMDDDVVQGHTLVSYELDPSAVVEPHRDLQVDLVVRDRTGRQQRRRATYQVVLKPNPAVVRND